MVNDLWFLVKTHQEILQWAALVSIISFISLCLAVPFIIIYLPKDYLISDHNPHTLPNIVRTPYTVLKNAFGGFLVLAGLAMLVLPGQGLLTLFIGLSLMNMPGKRNLIRRFACYSPIIHTINRLRKRAGKPALEIPECYT